VVVVGGGVAVVAEAEEEEEGGGDLGKAFESFRYVNSKEKISKYETSKSFQQSSLQSLHNRSQFSVWHSCFNSKVMSSNVGHRSLLF
jgi:hypothetical protein